LQTKNCCSAGWNFCDDRFIWKLDQLPDNKLKKFPHNKIVAALYERRPVHNLRVEVSAVIDRRYSDAAG
jgi:hypothetical protein